MVSLAFHGFGIPQTAALKLAENPEFGFWSFLKYQMSHVEWLGCSYWDLIQPSFMFIVGLSMAYSYVKRQREGYSYQQMLGHVIVRSLILIFSVFFSTPVVRARGGGLRMCSRKLDWDTPFSFCCVGENLRLNLWLPAEC